MTSYALGICEICNEPMTLQELREGVTWTEESKPTWLYGYACWWDPEEETHICHRRCWKELAEVERKYIRKGADEAPRSMGQRV